MSNNKDKFVKIKRHDFVKFRQEIFPLKITFPHFSFEDYDPEIVQGYLSQDTWGYTTDLDKINGSIKKNGHFNIIVTLPCKERSREPGDTGSTFIIKNVDFTMNVDTYGQFGKIIKSALYQDTYSYLTYIETSDLPFKERFLEVNLRYEQFLEDTIFRVEVILCKFSAGKRERFKYTNSSIQGIRDWKLHTDTTHLVLSDLKGFVCILPSALFDPSDVVF